VFVSINFFWFIVLFTFIGKTYSLPGRSTKVWRPAMTSGYEWVKVAIIEVSLFFVLHLKNSYFVVGRLTGSQPVAIHYYY